MRKLALADKSLRGAGRILGAVRLRRTHEFGTARRRGLAREGERVGIVALVCGIERLIEVETRPRAIVGRCFYNRGCAVQQIGCLGEAALIADLKPKLGQGLTDHDGIGAEEPLLDRESIAIVLLRLGVIVGGAREPRRFDELLVAGGKCTRSAQRSGRHLRLYRLQRGSTVRGRERYTRFRCDGRQKHRRRGWDAIGAIDTAATFGADNNARPAIALETATAHDERTEPLRVRTGGTAGLQ